MLGGLALQRGRFPSGPRYDNCSLVQRYAPNASPLPAKAVLRDALLIVPPVELIFWESPPYALIPCNESGNDISRFIKVKLVIKMYRNLNLIIFNRQQ